MFQSPLLYSQARPWHERVGLYGDLRLRYDATQRDVFQDDFRYRLRVGLEAAVHDAVRVGLEVRSGNPKNPVSDNQRFGGGFNGHEFSIAEAYSDFRLGSSFSVVAGKFEHPRYWMVSDMQWDGDVSLEGFLERVDYRVDFGFLARVGASAYQVILEQSGEGDAWLFGGQVRPTFGMGTQNLVTAGVGFDYFVDPQRMVGQTLIGELAGNRVTNLLDDSGTLVSDFHVATAFLNWRNSSLQTWPVSLSLFLYKNLGAGDAAGTDLANQAEGQGTENDTAFFFRIGADQGREPGELRIRFTYYYSEPDAILYAFMQSDTRRSSNLNGTRVDLRVGMPARTYFNFTWYRTKPNLGEAATMNRWQVDYVMGF